MKWTIQKKFIVGYLILFTLAALIVDQVMKDSLGKNSQVMIANEVTKLQHTTREHIKQFALIHPPQADLFKEYGGTIAQELSRLHTQNVALYDSEGLFLYEAIAMEKPLLAENQAYQMNLEGNPNPELIAAFNNQAAFTRVDVPDGNLVYFSYPLYLHDQFYGVLRFTGDSTNLFTANDKVLTSFRVLVICLFAGVFIISTLLTRQIIRPLLRLTAATKKVAAGNYGVDVHVKTKDELEVLAMSFNDMQQNIQRQMKMLEQEKDRVVQAEKSRTAFFNNVTHELKTPLATISGYAQIIGEEDFDDPVFLRKATGKIRLESERLNRMVIELIELAKREMTPSLKKREAIQLLPLILSVSEDMALKAGQRQIAIDVTGEGFIVDGNRDELRQVFSNVLDNAIKYGVSGARIVVVMKDGNITVTNDSPPVPDRIVDNAFEPFIHTKGEGSSGLGLSICQQIVSQHDGTIAFDYDDGRVVVSIVLPMVEKS
ncbi:HAMP domain-containing sensor histidine kinase [Sporosarcina sp. FSL K6-3457]|uniref:HAMP domain-containing sensor histidine kinase n=1 Tax=Sporosarcina sp. FSL K6-3457 TaxID=2978204 RepID=UPI0030F51462